MGKDNNKAVSDDQLQVILNQIAGIRYGSVTVIIQDGRIVQIERNEKIRFPLEAE